MVQIECLWLWFCKFGSEVEFVVQQKNFLNHRLNRRLVFSLHRFNRCLKSSWLGFCIASGTTSYFNTDGHRCFRCMADEPTLGFFTAPVQPVLKVFVARFLHRLWNNLRPLHRWSPVTTGDHRCNGRRWSPVLPMIGG